MARQNIAALRNRIVLKNKQIKALKQENLRLESEIKQYKRHVAKNTGHAGEQFLRKLLNAEVTQGNAGHDFLVRGKQRLEVKCSSCHINSRKYNSTYRKWDWTRLLGTTQTKKYDRLILLGKRDRTISGNLYRDPRSPFVIFDLSRKTAENLVNKRVIGVNFSMGTNPEKVGAAYRKRMWKYEVTRKEMIRDYGRRHK